MIRVGPFQLGTFCGGCSPEITFPYMQAPSVNFLENRTAYFVSTILTWTLESEKSNIFHLLNFILSHLNTVPK